MQKLVFYRTDSGEEFTVIVTREECYKGVMQAEIIGEVDLDILEYDFSLWCTDTPLIAEF